MNKKMLSLIICGAVGIGINFIGTNTASAAALESQQSISVEDSDSLEHFSAWPRIRDAILGREPSHDNHYEHNNYYGRGGHHAPPPPPPSPRRNFPHHGGPGGHGHYGPPPPPHR